MKRPPPMQPPGALYAQALEAFRQGDYDRAGTLIARFLQCEAGHAEALQLQGICAMHSGDPKLARQAFEAACRLAPAKISHWINLSEACQRLGESEAALRALNQALKLDPDFDPTYFYLAHFYKTRGELNTALEMLLRAQALAPGNARYAFNLAGLFYELGHLPQAVRMYTLTLGLDARDAQAHANLGRVLLEQKQDQQAMHHLQQALSLGLDPDTTARQLGLICESLGLLDEARRLLGGRDQGQDGQQALRLHRDTLIPTLSLSRAHIDASRRALMERIGHWRAKDLSLQGNEIHEHLQPPFSLIYHGCDNRALLQAYAGLFTHSFGELKQQIRQRRTGLARMDRPCLGFVVTPGHEGIFARYFELVFRHLPVGRYHLRLVADARAWQSRLAPVLAHPDLVHLPLPERFEQAALALAGQPFDLLYHWEVGTDPINYFLPFLELAPVQCTSLGTPQTSGIPFMTHFLSSRRLEAPGAQAQYSEQLHLFDGLPLICAPPDFAAEALDLASLGISPRHTSYICLQNPAKLHPDFDQLLGEILRRDPRGRVYLLSHRSPFITEQLRYRLSFALPDLAHRIEILPRMPWEQCLSLMQQADFLLDSIYCAGANTSLEALAAGTPVITWPWQQARGRYTAACYGLMGIEGLTASDFDDYVARAVELANDKIAQQAFRQQILAARGALFSRPEAVVEEYLAFFDAVLQSQG